MPDDLNFNQPANKGENADGSQITSNPSPSPLEESNPPASPVPAAPKPEVPELEKPEPAPSAPEPASALEPEKPELVTPEPPVAPVPPVSPANPSSPAGGGESETAKAPDTDEFLKSILDEKPVTQAATPEESIAGAPEESTPAALSVPSVSAPISDESALDGGKEQAPKIKDEISGLDQIIGPSEGSKAGENGPSETKSISSDIFSAAAKSAGKSNSLKLVILILVALVVVIGGYILFTRFFGKSTTSTLTTATPVSNASSEATATTKATLDNQRKSDLHTIQEALINYFAAQSKYPVSEKLVLLSTSGNILEKELIPTYLNKLPADPVATKSYGYKSDGKTFTLTAVLDNTSDPDVTLEGGLPLFEVTPSTVFESTTPAASAAQPAAGVSPFANVDNPIENTGEPTITDESPAF
jgi:flagellar basal body-associated protein FliL